MTWNGNVVKKEDIKFLPIYTGVEGEENRDFVSEQKTISVSTVRFLKLTRKHLRSSWNGCLTARVEKLSCNGILGMIPPFSTFGEDERPDNPLVQDMLSYMNDDSLYSIPWDFSTFPSQEFKTSLEAISLNMRKEI